MVVGFASGLSERESLDRMLVTSHPDQIVERVPVSAISLALKRHAAPLMQALDVACLYRNKTRMVMWAHNGAAKQDRLSQVARSWGFKPENIINDIPLYSRHIRFKGMVHDDKGTTQ